MTPDRPLANVGVLVTRPASQAAGFIARLKELGAEPLLFPALTILPPLHSDVLDAVLRQLAGYDLAIFISPTAAEWGLAASGPWPVGTRVAAVGRGTAQSLAARGVHSILAPVEGADSEHLLALPELAEVGGKRIVIFRGEGGRELLADVLRSRGAQVDYAECYRRGCPAADPAPVMAGLAAGRIRAITAFSRETLDNLMALLGEACQPALFAQPLFVPHPRIAEHGGKLGFRTILTRGPGESGLIAGLVEYFTHA